MQTHEDHEDEHEAAQCAEDRIPLRRGGTEHLAKHGDEDPEEKAGRHRILQHPADLRIEGPQPGF